MLARDVGRIDYDHVEATVYFTKIGEAGLFKLDPESGAETLVTRKINPAHLDGWLVLAGQVFYIEPQAVGPSKVHDLDPATGEDRVVADDSGLGRRLQLQRVARPAPDRHRAHGCRRTPTSARSRCATKRPAEFGHTASCGPRDVGASAPISKTLPLRSPRQARGCAACASPLARFRLLFCLRRSPSPACGRGLG